MDDHMDEYDREAQRSGYSSPWSWSPDDRNLSLDGTRISDDPCDNCGVGLPVFEALLIAGDPASPCNVCVPLYWRCPECGHTKPLVLDRYHAR